MKKENKEQLLLKDLCARLPYGVKVHINSPIEEQNSMELFDVNFDSKHIGVGNEKWAFRAIPIIDDEDEAKVVKPYLRPMSSMTEEENKQRKELGILLWSDSNGKRGFDGFGNISGEDILKAIDWLNAHHFDYRDLIGKGLALEAPDGMYGKF